MYGVWDTIHIIRCHDSLSTRFEVSTMMALVGAVDDATMGAKLEFGEESSPAVLVVHTFIVLKENCTLVIRQHGLGDSNNDGKSQFLCDKFIKTDHISTLICILEHIPVSTKESSITTTISHNN